MARPIINKILPFDATKDYTVTFTYFGNLPKESHVQIYDGNSASLLTTINNTGTQASVVIPGNTLQNGVKYAIEGSVTYNISDTDIGTTPWSEKVYFIPMETPTYGFSNLHNGSTITNALYEAEIDFNSSAGDTVKSYNFYLYDQFNKLLIKSDTLYDSQIKYIYKGLLNNTDYKFEWQGITETGVLLNTSVNVRVKYENPLAYAKINITCDKETSAMRYETNFVSLEAKDPDSYMFNNGYIDIIDKTLVYDQDYVVDGDATWILQGRYLFRTGDILVLKNGKNQTLSLTSIYISDDVIKYRLKVPGVVSDYILYSDNLEFDNLDDVSIYIRRKNGVYSLTCLVEFGSFADPNMVFGGTTPNDEELRIQLYDVWVDIDSAINKDGIDVLANNKHVVIGDDEDEHVTILGKTTAPTSEELNNADLFTVWLEDTEDES